MRAGGAIAGRRAPIVRPAQRPVAALEAAHRRDRRRSARRRPARRRCSMRSSRPHAAGAAALDGGGDHRARSSRPMADAAEAGAVATIPMLATKGRASYLGERSIGHQDPGATSSALLLARPGRRGRAPAEPDRRGRCSMTRTSSSDGPARPASGVGRLLLVAPSRTARPAPRRGARAGRRSTPHRSARVCWPRSRPRPPSSRRSPARWRSGPGTEIGAIFEAQALFARDPGHRRPGAARDRRRDDAPTRRSSPARDEQAGILAAVDDEYFRARAADVRDVGRRVADPARRRAATRPVARRRRSRPSSSPRTSIHRRSRRSGPSSSPGSPSAAAPRPVTRRSSPAASASRSSSASGRRDRRASRRRRGAGRRRDARRAAHRRAG